MCVAWERERRLPGHICLGRALRDPYRNIHMGQTQHAATIFMHPALLATENAAAQRATPLELRYVGHNSLIPRRLAPQEVLAPRLLGEHGPHHYAQPHRGRRPGAGRHRAPLHEHWVGAVAGSARVVHHHTNTGWRSALEDSSGLGGAQGQLATCIVHR